MFGTSENTDQGLQKPLKPLKYTRSDEKISKISFKHLFHQKNKGFNVKN